MILTLYAFVIPEIICESAATLQSTVDNFLLQGIINLPLPLLKIIIDPQDDSVRGKGFLASLLQRIISH